MSIRILSLIFLMLVAPGCVHRRMTIHSDPPGALVKVDGKVIGYSPASFDYTWYGKRKVQVLKDGYETQTQLVDLSAPWYQRFPFEFFSDNLAMQHIEDRRQLNISMVPRRPDSSSDVLSRGRAMKSQAN